MAVVPQLEQLHLLYTNIADNGLERLAPLKKLRVLDLRGCATVTDAGLAHLPALENLERLKLRNPSVTDAGMKSIKKMKKLKGLWLEDTQLSDQGLADLEGLTALDEFVPAPHPTSLTLGWHT